jgi:hypothetical protein
LMNQVKVPDTIEQIVLRFDARTEPYTEFDIGGEIKAARGALLDLSEPEKAGAWAEALAFSLATGHHQNP